MATKIAESIDFSAKTGKLALSFLGDANPDSKRFKQLLMIGMVLLVILIVGLILFFVLYPSETPTTTEKQDDRKEAHAKFKANSSRVEVQESKKEGFATAQQIPVKTITGWEAKLSLYGVLLKSLDPQERYLVNLCPLTASVGGFLGPVSKGVFDPNYFVRTCLASGIRSFVLPISTYFDDNKTPPNWPYSTKPAIVYRSDTGEILSENGLSVKKFCEALVINRSENPDQAEEPILLYLYADEANLPNKSTEEKAYVKLMADLGEELQTLNPYLLKTYGTMGSMVNARREREILLEIPLTDLKNKIITFTNFDFPLAQKKEYASLASRLGDSINFSLAPVVANNAGLGKGVGARALRLEDVSGSKIEWKNEARNIWHTTLLSSLSEMPSAAVVDNAIRTGIQAIPCPWVFKDEDPNALQVWRLWKGYAFRLKEPSARYAKPVPIAPQTPSAKLNARVDSTLQPGQTQIK